MKLFIAGILPAVGVEVLYKEMTQKVTLIVSFTHSVFYYKLHFFRGGRC